MELLNRFANRYALPGLVHIFGYKDNYDVQKCTGIWTTEVGVPIPISEMDDRHLQNSINMLNRKNAQLLDFYQYIYAIHPVEAVENSTYLLSFYQLDTMKRKHMAIRNIYRGRHSMSQCKKASLDEQLAFLFANHFMFFMMIREQIIRKRRIEWMESSARSLRILPLNLA